MQAAPKEGDAPARVRAFFEVQLPRRIAERGALFDQVQGTLALFIEGAGAWTIGFGDHQSPQALTAEADFDRDCVTVFSVDGFDALLDGRSDGPEPVLIGDDRLLARLGQLLIAPTRGVLGARLER